MSGIRPARRRTRRDRSSRAGPQASAVTRSTAIPVPTSALTTARSWAGSRGVSNESYRTVQQEPFLLAVAAKRATLRSRQRADGRRAERRSSCTVRARRRLAGLAHGVDVATAAVAAGDALERFAGSVVVACAAAIHARLRIFERLADRVHVARASVRFDVGIGAGCVFFSRSVRHDVDGNVGGHVGRERIEDDASTDTSGRPASDSSSGAPSLSLHELSATRRAQREAGGAVQSASLGALQCSSHAWINRSGRDRALTGSPRRCPPASASHVPRTVRQRGPRLPRDVSAAPADFGFVDEPVRATA